MKRVIVDGKSYEFDENEMTNRDAIALEEFTGWGVAEWGQKLTTASGKALTYLVWYVRSRTEPGLRINDVEFKLATLDLADDAEQESPKAAPGPWPQMSTVT